MNRFEATPTTGYDEPGATWYALFAPGAYMVFTRDHHRKRVAVSGVVDEETAMKTVAEFVGNPEMKPSELGPGTFAVNVVNAGSAEGGQ